jgi:cysteine-rich repeat protein
MKLSYNWLLGLGALAASACGAPVCGDLKVEAGEACDDGNADAADGCDSDCTTNSCADGVADPGELCLSPREGFPIDGEQPNFIRHGDFNGDTFLDLAILGQDTLSMSVLLNDSDGNFPQLKITALEDNVRDLAIADFDGDGLDDIAAGRPDLHVAQVFRSLGDGTFAAPINVEVNVSVAFLVAVDIDLDGDVDLLSDGADTVNNGDSIVVVRNQGDGTFADPEVTPSQRPFGFAVADLNADGRLDLAVSKPLESEVEILLGQADGSFFSLVSAPTGTQPEQVFAVAVDGGAALDLLTLNRATNDFSVFLGEGNGTFAGEQRFTPEAQPIELLVGDINQDARPEVFVRVNNRVQLFFGQGGFLFEAPRDFFAGEAPDAIDVADFNNDGFDDLIIAFGSENAAVAPSVAQPFLSKP